MEQLSRSGSFQKIDKPNEETIEPLAKAAADLASQARSPATALAYRRDFETFADWANDRGLDFLPAAPETIALYVAHLDEENRAPATVRRVLSSLSQAHKAFDLESPTSSAKVLEVLKGLARKRGTAQRQAKPLLARHIMRMVSEIPPDVVGKRDRAIILIGWSGALRRSEICALRIEDIERVDEGIVLTIRRSKGDPTGRGQKVAIPRLQNAYCPVGMLDAWLSLSGIQSGFVFCAVGISGKNRFFEKVDNSKKFNSRMITLLVKKYAARIGLNPADYSAHSLRAGWVTSAAAINTPDHIMMRHTRHRSLATLLGYVRDGELFNDCPLPLLLAAGPPPKS